MYNLPIQAAWESDWNGYEVGFDDSDVVGYYSFTTAGGETYYLYVDMETCQVLEVEKE